MELYRVRAEAAGEVLQLGDSLVATVDDDVGGAELLRELLTVGVPAEDCDVPLGTESWRAAGHSSRPTAPSPTTATVFPGPVFGGNGGNQPVPSTSEAPAASGSRSSVGKVVVATRVPSASGIRAYWAWVPSVADALGVDTAGLIARPADLAGVVRGEERSHDELTRFHVRTSRRSPGSGKRLGDPVPGRSTAVRLLNRCLVPSSTECGTGRQVAG